MCDVYSVGSTIFPPVLRTLGIEPITHLGRLSWEDPGATQKSSSLGSENVFGCHRVRGYVDIDRIFESCGSVKCSLNLTHSHHMVTLSRGSGCPLLF